MESTKLGINLDQIANWPKKTRLMLIAGACLAIIFGGYFFDLRVQLNKIKYGKSLEISQKKEIHDQVLLTADLTKDLQEHGNNKKTIDGLSNNFAQNNTSIESFLFEIAKISNQNYLPLDSVKVLGTQEVGDLSKTSISITAKGSYQKIARFIAAITRMPNIVTFEKMELTANKDRESDKGLISLSCTIGVYQIPSTAGNNKP